VNTGEGNIGVGSRISERNPDVRKILDIGGEDDIKSTGVRPLRSNEIKQTHGMYEWRGIMWWIDATDVI
jgi:hypothetical protein